MRTKLPFLIAIFFTTFSYSLKGQKNFVFPELPYSYDALEVFIDKTTMEIHYSRHHKAYYNNFVKTLDESGLGNKSIEELFANVSKHPVSIRNNGGGYYNHNLFWEIMSPVGGGIPKGELLKAIEKAFLSFEEFTNKFENAAKGQFGSGWAWLAVDKEGNLFVSSTPNQDNPLMDVAEKRGTPILGLDVWEHAYYLHYQNKRADYVSNFWKVVNWKTVEEKYLNAVSKSK
jgi:Fe-Mn family superoxide dismutase